ncbi:MAG: hypothetical protein AAFO91_08585 [Bacteroidota bacterium]
MLFVEKYSTDLLGKNHQKNGAPTNCDEEQNGAFDEERFEGLVPHFGQMLAAEGADVGGGRVAREVADAQHLDHDAPDGQVEGVLLAHQKDEGDDEVGDDLAVKGEREGQGEAEHRRDVGGGLPEGRDCVAAGLRLLIEHHHLDGNLDGVVDGHPPHHRVDAQMPSGFDKVNRRRADHARPDANIRENIVHFDIGRQALGQKAYLE